MDQSDYNQLLDLLYDAAVEPGLWPNVLARFAHLIGASGGSMIKQNELTGKGEAVQANVDPASVELYYGHFATRNILQQVNDPQEWMKNWAPCVITDEHKLPKHTLMRSEYYNDFMRQFDMHSLLIVRVALLGMDAVSLSMVRPASRSQFGSSEIELTNRLQPHFIRAFGLSQKFGAVRMLKDDMADFLDGTPHGLFLLDERGRVRHANRVGRNFLGEAGGLCLINGRLSAGRPEAARALEALIASAASSDPSRRRGGSMALPSSSRRLPLSLTVAPVRAARREVFDRGPSVIVCVSDLEADVSLPEQTLRELFGLTNAEARVALTLFEGATPRETAESLGISYQTVRVHLQRVLEKTDTRRQTELARLMMRAIGARVN